jgi:plastocyanin
VTSRSVSIALVALVAGSTVVGCGGDNGDSGKKATDTGTEETTPSKTSGGGQLGIPGRVDLRTPAGNELVFKPAKVTAKTLDGKLTISWDNDSKVGHNICMEDERGKAVFECSKVVKDSGASESAGADPGGVATPITNLKPGKYTYYCSVDGHRQAGMEGTLTVTG